MLVPLVFFLNVDKQKKLNTDKRNGTCSRSTIRSVKKESTAEVTNVYFNEISTLKKVIVQIKCDIYLLYQIL